MLSFRQADADQMKRVEHELAQVLLRFRDNTEASLVIFALLRCARILLRRYPAPTELALRRVCVDYLEARDAPRDDALANMIVSGVPS